MLIVSPWGARQMPGICHPLHGSPLRGPGGCPSRAESPLEPWYPQIVAPTEAVLLPLPLLLPVQSNLVLETSWTMLKWQAYKDAT